LFAVVAVAIILIKSIFTANFSAGYLYAAVVLSFAMIFAEYLLHVLRGLGSISGALLPRDIAWRPLAIVLLMFAFIKPVSAQSALLVFALLLIILVIVQFVFSAWPRIKDEIRRENEDVSLSDSLGIWKRTSRSLWVSASIGPSLQHISVVILGLTMLPAETGPYFAAMKTAAILSLPLQSLNLVVAPKIAKAYAKRDIAEVKRLALFSALISGGLGLVGLMFLAMIGVKILAQFDPNFTIAYEALLIIGAGFTVSALCGSSAYLMTMTGHERAHVKILLTSNLMAILLMSFLSFKFGIIGAAIGFSLGTMTWNIAITVWAKRNIGVDPSVFGLLEHLKFARKDGVQK
jgi:O-antigen/teichoic acid export membrane protein